MSEQEFDEVIAAHLKGHLFAREQLLFTGEINLKQVKILLEE